MLSEFAKGWSGDVINVYTPKRRAADSQGAETAGA